MPRLSRWMKPIHSPHRTVSGFAFVATVLAAVAILAFVYPVAGVLSLCIVVLGVFSAFDARRRLKALKAQRVGEDIGTFARAFDRRAPTFDPLLARAVWDSVQSAYGPDAPVPLRPSDRPEDLLLDEEEFDFDALAIIAERAGRSLEGLERNPYYGHVATLADLVSLLASQPRIAAA